MHPTVWRWRGDLDQPQEAEQDELQRGAGWKGHEPDSGPATEEVSAFSVSCHWGDHRTQSGEGAGGQLRSEACSEVRV